MVGTPPGLEEAGASENVLEEASWKTDVRKKMNRHGQLGCCIKIQQAEIDCLKKMKKISKDSRSFLFHP